MSYKDRQLREKFDQIVEDAVNPKNPRNFPREIQILDMNIGYLELHGDFSLLELRKIVAAWEEVYPDRETVISKVT